MRPHSLFLVGLLLAATARAAEPSAPPPPPPAAIDELPEVDVLGEQPGPGLWKITRGDHTLWVLGTLDHVPRRMTWHSRQVESALASSQALLPSNPALSTHLSPVLLVRLYVQWRGLQKDPDRTRLRDWLSPALYMRFETQKQRFDAGDDRIEKLRPPFAALRLYDRALQVSDLTRSNAIEAAVLELARRRHVPIERAQLRVEDPLGTLKQARTLSPAAEVNCLDSTVHRLETDLPRMQQRAHAWAVGDVQQLRQLPFEDEREACEVELSAVPDLRALADAAARNWLQTADTMLAQHRVSFAVQPIYQLLAIDGPLAHFRSEGDRVEAPR
ncbi:MAG TPA: TraB/GumN family protein [Steroidobacteraceae bacterium]|nr:TraB/GumN family protein [Steroidobacteraceae bacterium]